MQLSIDVRSATPSAVLIDSRERARRVRWTELITGAILLSMPDRNIEIVRALYDAWAREEFPGPTELLDPEIEYINPEDAVEPGTRHGLDEFNSAVARVFEGWTTWHIEPERFESAEDRVAVVVRYRAVGRSSGLKVEGHESALWTLRHGRVVRYAWFTDPTEALDALGLPA